LGRAPWSARTLPQPGSPALDLKFIALDFDDRNCVGCAHRKPVGFPNLSALVHERDQAALRPRPCRAALIATLLPDPGNAEERKAIYR
jgi:hypothetical protein